LKKYRSCRRRLRKTIPRIPILRGDASVQGGSEEEITKNFGLDLDFKRFTKTKTKTTTPNKFPILDTILASIIILTSRGKGSGKGIKLPAFLRNLFKGRNKVTSPTTIDDILKQIDKQIKELEKARKFVPQSLRNAQKNLQLVKQNQTTASRMSAAYQNNKNIINKGQREAKLANKLLKENKLFVKRETETIRDSISFTRKMIKEDLTKNPVDAFENIQVARQSFNLQIKSLKDLIKTNKTLPKGRVKAIRQVIAELKKAMKEIDDIAAELSEKYPKILEEFQNQQEFFRKLSGGSKFDQQEFKKLWDLLNEKNRSPTSSNLNVKPMSNDIAMLNTDTGYRDIYLIKVTDPNSIT